MKKALLVLLAAGMAAVTPVLAEQSKPGAAPEAGAAAEPTLETSEGALKLFIAAMRRGDFERVVELCDPGAQAYDDLRKMAESFDPDNPANQAADKKQVLDVVRDFFTKPWRDVEHKLIAEQGSRAQYSLSFYFIDEKTKERKKGEDRVVDLNKFEGEWRVLVSAELMKPAVPSQVPNIPQGQKPADKPTEQH